MARRHDRTRRAGTRPLGLTGSHWRADGRPKVRYPSAAEAAAAAEERGRDDGVDLGVYDCGFCGGWHMGASVPRDAR